MTAQISQSRVLETQQDLPVFPPVVMKILEALDDPDASLQLLVTHVEREPVVAGRVLSLANRAGNSTHGSSPVSDVFTAVSLVGLARVREIALKSSLTGFLQDFSGAGQGYEFWRHSLAVAVCGMELARQAPIHINVDMALVAGLLHDVGQLWLHRFEPALMQRALQNANSSGADITVAEREIWGIDHGVMGGWLVQSWGVDSGMTQAVIHHHAPEQALTEPLVSVVHVAEVLSSALALTGLQPRRIAHVSAGACSKLGLDWGSDTHRLFGRIEARNRHAFAELG
jgi:putative nucleotidyltransferase with HDIG domain